MPRGSARGARIASAPGVSSTGRDDSGVIDLFAIHEQAKRAQATPAPTPSPFADTSAPLSAPPPAVSFDTAGDDDVDAMAFASFGKPKAKLKWIAAGASAFLVLGLVVVAAFSGGEEPPKAAAAAVQAPPPPAPPPPAPEPPKPVAEAAPVPPPPPTAVAEAKPAPKKGKAVKATKRAAPKKRGGGVKLIKVQSSGVP